MLCISLTFCYVTQDKALHSFLSLVVPSCTCSFMDPIYLCSSIHLFKCFNCWFPLLLLPLIWLVSVDFSKPSFLITNLQNLRLFVGDYCQQIFLSPHLPHALSVIFSSLLNKITFWLASSFLHRRQNMFTIHCCRLVLNMLIVCLLMIAMFSVAE